MPYRTKPTVRRSCFCCNLGADIFVGITIYRSHKKGRFGRSVETPHNILAPESTLTRVNSSRVNSHSPLCQLVPCVNSSPSQLVPESTRPLVNCSQLVPGSTRTRVNSSPSQRPRFNSPRVNSSPRQLVPVSHFVPKSTRPRVNSSPGQLEPGSTRPQVNSSPSQLAPVNSSPSHLVPVSHFVPESTRLRVNSPPSQLVL